MSWMIEELIRNVSAYRRNSRVRRTIYIPKDTLSRTRYVNKEISNGGHEAEGKNIRTYTVDP